MAFIELHHLGKTFKQKNEEVVALDDINISIEKSDIYGIIGMSGAGKSTLVRCLNYLEEPTQGEVIVDGRNLGELTEKELRQERSRIAMIFQHFNLLMQKNVISNVCFPLQLQKVSRKDARKKAKELLETVGLADKAKAYPSQLSGGQKQRVAIARALASDPQILLCDEATSALDPQTTDSILKLLKEINERFGITIVIITHQMSVIQEICNRVAIIEDGHLVEEGKVDEIFAKPKSKAAKKLILGETGQEIAGTRKSVKEMTSDKKIRVVFSENSSYEPVISNMILKFQAPVNILHANTRNVGGIAKGEIILGLPEDEETQKNMEKYLTDRGLSVQEVTEDV
ncbi:MAG: ATP-binding cassette domain-containing protein [Lachnospiraceae bacterium]|nr:ATP-binding cassette domain-containing protein [Lachnospiraceae bacterium]